MMKTARYPILFILSVVLASAGLYGQVPVPGDAESVFVTTDRDIYFAGENMWLGITCLGNENRPDDNSKVTYLELLSSDNKVISQTMMLMKNAGSSGNLVIPSSLSSGFYLLRAYTNKMKNYGAGCFFYKKLMILNPVQGGRFNYPVKDTGMVDNKDITVFPEGGTIYQNLYNRVYVQFDKPLSKSGMKGWVVSQYYDTLTSLKFIRQNLAWFDFIPGTPKYYLSLPGLEEWFPLDINRQPGSILKVQPSFDRYALSLESNDSTVKATPLYIEVRSLEKPSEKIYREAFNNSKILEASRLADGFSKLSLTTAGGDLIAENYLYRPPGGNLKVTVSTDKKAYQNREKAEITLETSDASGNPVNTVLSVSVRKKNSTPVHNTRLRTFLTIPGKYKALAEDWNLDNMNEASAFIAEYGEDIFSGKEETGRLKYGTDHSGITVSGKLEKGNQSVPGAVVYLSVVGDSAMIFPGITSGDGDFSFAVHDLTGERDIIVKSTDSLQNAYFTLDDSYFSNYVKFMNYPNSLDSSFSRSLNSQFYTWQVRRTYQQDDAIPAETCLRDFNFFGNADFSIRMKDYVELPLLEEVFFEIVPPVMVLHKDKKAYLKVIDKYTNRTIGDNPLYLVDGVAIFDPDVIMAISPSIVRDISVVQNRYFLHSRIFDGIIIINTINNDFSDVDFNGAYTRKKMHFAQPAELFTNALNEDGVGSSEPDFRNLLLWAPHVMTGKNGKTGLSFYTSDDNSTWQVVVEGLDQEGRACYGVSEFSVGQAR